MPGKHVHFADPGLDTPSPSWTISSLPSSTGPITPPQAAGIALPSVAGPCYVHPVLAPSLNIQLDFDVSLPSSAATIRDPKLSQYALTQPATGPALPYLEIIIPSLPWRLIIYNNAERGGVVTVSDVLAGIYANLRTGVTGPEFNGVSEEARAGITKAYTQRCTRGATSDAAAKQLKKGVKRIDFLQGRNTFQGLTPTKLPHVWVMDTSA
ncbi:hypothetical protein D9611_011136 [Ephemerocybe angulata]|uniref:DUF6699 domain-containing protein n=1 Tax=Ephemerocybe angulata TaxID=980116 RepID=A0A8H5CDL2_9AGAR|nr:hypothetical protein D9611_011136 [Tulosesus angulatus]